MGIVIVYVNCSNLSYSRKLNCVIQHAHKTSHYPHFTLSKGFRRSAHTQSDEMPENY